MSLTNASQLLCLVCNSNIDVNTFTNIFYVSLPHNGDILANFVLKVLKLSSSDLHSSYVCLRCYNLFEMLEKAQWTAANIQSEIFKVFQGSSDGKPFANGSVDNIVTENFLEVERLGTINEQKVIVTEHLSGKDFNSLNNITNQITNSSVISNEIEIKHNDHEYSMIYKDDETKLTSYIVTKEYVGNNKVSNKVYKTEAISLSDDISLFSDEIVETTDSENQRNLDWQDAENATVLQSSTNGNEMTVLPKPQENTENQRTWKSGGMSKYSQKPLKHTCPTCGKMWRTSTQLKTHLISHSNLRPFMCEKCGQAYKHKRALEIHVGIHNGVSPFRCSHCGKCFTQKGALQRHQPMHTGEMPYQCELCGKRFVHHTSYSMHVLSHTGKKSHKCHVCDLSLLSTSHLKRHMRVHTGEKPYSCDLCGKSFAERYNLLAHKKIHDPSQIPAKVTKRNQHKCEQCEATFAKKQKLDEHMQQQHSIDLKSNEKLLGQTVDVVEPQPHETYATNGAEMLYESCVNEVWQSLSKSGEKLKVNDNGTSNHDRQS